MRKTALYLLFFMPLYSAMAQEQVRRLQVFTSTFKDSLQLANRQFEEGMAIGLKDTAQSMPLFRKAMQVYHAGNLALEEGKCHMAIADIFFESGQYNRYFGNYVTAQDLFYEVNTADLMLATLGVAKSQYHRGLYRFAIKAFSEVITYGFKNNNEVLKASAAEYLGNIFFILQLNKESKNNFTSAFTANRKLNDEKGSLRMAEKLYTLHYQDRQFDSALWYAGYCVEAANRINQKTILQTSTHNRIAALIRLKRMEEANREITRFAEKLVPRSDLSTRIRFESITGNYSLALNDPGNARIRYD